VEKPTLNNILFIAIMIILLITSSCSFRKTSSTGIRLKNFPSDVLIDSLINNSIQYSFLKSKSNADLFFEAEKKQIKVNIRARKDSLIWVNLSKSSVQVLTCLISKDSIKFLKKIGQKEYFLGDYDDVEKIIGFKLNYMLIQNFINGNALMLDTNVNYVSSIDDDSYLLSTYKSKKIDKLLQSNKDTDHQLLYRCWIDPENYKCKKVAINLLDIDNTVIAEYSNWKKIKDNLIPMKSSITYINQIDTISIALQYHTNIKLNNKLTFPFRINNNYSPFNIEFND